MFRLHRCDYGMGCFCGENVGERFEGLGVYNFPTGSRYEGEFKDGMFHGKGKFCLFVNTIGRLV